MARYKSQATKHTRDTVSAALGGDIAGDLAKFTEAIQGKAARAGAFAAATVLYDEMSVRVPTDEGTLKGALYRWHDEDQSADGKQVFAVGVNKRKAPHWHLVEYGHWRHYRLIKIGDAWVTLRNRPLDTPEWVPASPYIRPSFDAKISSALLAAKQRMVDVLQETKR